MKTSSILLFALMLLFPLTVSGSSDLIPEMQECMTAHGSQAEYMAALKKYCDPGIMLKAMGLLLIKNPHVVKTEKDQSAVCYTVEGAAVETSSEIPAETLQVYKVCWESGRIVSLEFYGPKQRPRDQDIIPEMQDCLRAHDSREKYEKALEKYSDPGIIRKAMALLLIKEPAVIKVEQDGPVMLYTVQGRTPSGSSEIAADDIQVYRVGWKGGRIVSLEFVAATVR